jgi:hypothetical protein
MIILFQSEGTGQLETIGDGYQHLNNKQLSRALMDYLQYVSDQVRIIHLYTKWHLINPALPAARQCRVFTHKESTGFLLAAV